MTETPPPALSETELAILQQVATGATNREVAHARGISEATVKKHLTNINGKLGTGNRTEAVRRALEMGLITVDTPGSADGLEREAARRLAEELERTRRRSRQLVRWYAATGVVVALLALAIVYLVAVRDQPSPDPGPPPAPAAATPVWEPGANLPEARSGLALVADDSDGSVYAIAGRSADGLLAETLRYPLQGYRWEPLATKPTPVEDVAAVEVRGEFIVPGGCDASGQATDVVEIYDPKTDVWRSGPSLPEPLCGYALAELQGEIYLLGGRTSAEPATASKGVWRRDPQSGEWSSVSEMPLPRSDLAVVVEGNRIRVLGGRDRSGDLQTNHWVYRPFEPDARAWSSEDRRVLPEGRAGHTAVVSSVGNIYLVGGGWDTPLDDGALVLRLNDPNATWEQDVDVRGFTPQRGAGMALVDGRLLVLAGGAVDARDGAELLLDRHHRREVVSSLILPR